MRPLVLLLVALVSVLALAGPVGAARSHPPKKLWSEYPLAPRTAKTAVAGSGAAASIATPPAADVEAAPPGGAGSTRWALWAAMSALTVLAVLVVARVSQPLLDATTRRTRDRPSSVQERATPEPVQLRAHPQPLVEPRARGAPLAQYAPEPTVAERLVEPEPSAQRSVVRRTGILRSRYVVVADEPDGHVRELARSRSFWRVGGEGFREHAAEQAWDELVQDLRTSGWEPDSERRSDFYVLLREVEDVRGGASILPTLEAYTHEANGSKDG
jgi:hypothetical protein